MFKARGQDIIGSHKICASVPRKPSLILEEMPEQQPLEIRVCNRSFMHSVSTPESIFMPAEGCETQVTERHLSHVLVDLHHGSFACFALRS